MFGQAPEWFDFALHELGTREEPENRGPAIQRYIDLAGCGEQGDPWCAIFANAMFALCDIPGTGSPSSQSFAHDNNFTKLDAPCLGCVVVFWRSHPHSGIGHVGFYRGELNGYIYTLGGNEGDMVQIEALPKDGGQFGLVGYYWPVGIPVPVDQLGAITMPAGTPPHQTSAPEVT